MTQTVAFNWRKGPLGIRWSGIDLKGVYTTVEDQSGVRTKWSICTEGPAGLIFCEAVQIAAMDTTEEALMAFARISLLLQLKAV